MTHDAQSDIVDLPCAVLLTALQSEYTAVREHLEISDEKMRHPEGDVYTVGLFRTYSGRIWKVGVAEIGQGQTAAAAATERMISYFKPQIAMFVGVAGGLKDVRIGDVVAATKVYGYERGKAVETFQPRPELFHSTFGLEGRARTEARESAWLARVLVNVVPPSTPRVFVAPIAAGDKVIASERSEVRTFLRNNFNDSLAVEMEGGGFLEVLHRYEGVRGLVVRGISDLIEGKSQAEVRGSQELAARHAAAFAFEVLSCMDGDTVRGPATRYSPWDSQRFARVVFAIGSYRNGLDQVLPEVARLEGLRLVPVAERERAAELLARESALGEETCLFVLSEAAPGSFEVSLGQLNSLRPSSARFLICCAKDDGRDAISCVQAGASAYLVGGRLGNLDSCFRHIRMALRRESPYPKRPEREFLQKERSVLVLLPCSDYAMEEFKRGIMPAAEALNCRVHGLRSTDPEEPELERAHFVLADVSSRSRGVDPWIVSRLTSALNCGSHALLIRRSNSAALPPHLEALGPLEYNTFAELSLKLYFGLRD